MKLLAEKKALLKGFQIIQNAISTKTTLMALSNFLLEAKKGGLKFSATDLEIAVSTTIPDIKVETEGAITIPAKKFGDIIKEMPEDKPIEIKVIDEKQTNINCGRSHFSLISLAAKEYPELLEFPQDKTSVLPTEDIREMINKIIFATSTDDTRYVLNGGYCVFEKNTVTFVGTDGVRLAVITRFISSNKINHSAIIPAKTLNELVRLLSIEEAKEIKIGFTANQVSFKINETILSSRLIDGDFPNYAQVIPKKHSIQAELKTAEFLSAVRQVSFLLTDRSSGNGIKLSFKPKGLIVSTSSPSFGSAEVEVELVKYSGEPIEIYFNPAYLLDYLKNIEDETILLQLTNSLAPALLRPAPDENYLYILVPLRV